MNCPVPDDEFTHGHARQTTDLALRATHVVCALLFLVPFAFF